MKKKNLVNYNAFNCPEEGTTFIQGIRGKNGTTDEVYIAGSLAESNGITQGLLYQGPLSFNGNEGKWHKLMFSGEGVENVINTSCYGPNNLPNGDIQLVGSYKVEGDKNTKGFLYEGPCDGSGKWTTVSPNNGETKMVFLHSVMGGYAVGNYDTHVSNGFAFVYNISTKEFIDIAVDGAHSTTLYGIWYNGGNSYTMAGGCSFDGPENLSQAFIVDWNSETKETSNWKFYQYLGEDLKTLVTHFEGITSDGNGGYNLPSDWVAVEPLQELRIADRGAFVNIARNEDGTFSDAKWIQLDYPITGVEWTSANTAYKNTILGVYLLPNSSGGMYTISYTADVHSTAVN